MALPPYLTTKGVFTAFNKADERLGCPACQTERMLIRRKADLIGTARHVKTHAYETVRFLLESDNAGLTVTDITLAPDLEEVYGSDTRLEIAYCIAGRARLQEVGSSTWHDIEPGTLWMARGGQHFRFVALEPTRLICVFDPAFTGLETGFARDAEG
jgi:L-ectoine synthase